MILVFVQFLFQMEVSAQYADIDKDIAEHRKGKLIIKANAGDKVKVEQLKHEFWFGAAISNGFADGSIGHYDIMQYQKKFIENFNAAVTENAVKWQYMEPRRGFVYYQVVDGILDWTEQVNIPLRAHNLYWGVSRYVQPWVKELDKEELREVLESRAVNITERYQGRFAEYDLNNEMLHEHYYESRLGPEITKQMAAWALKGDPDAKLYLNDYDILTGKMLAPYMAQIRSLLADSVPIAGIGVQGHSHGETFNREMLRRALDSLATFNLPIRITEFNMPGQHSRFSRNKDLQMDAQQAELAARELVDYYKICFAHPAVEGIMMWGFWEGANWIPASSLYKRDWSPTPAAEAYRNLVYKEWWTQESGTVGQQDVFTIPAFFGSYKITVNGHSKMVNLTKKEGKTMVDFSKH